MSIEACVGILNSLLQVNLLDQSQHQDLVDWSTKTNADPSALGKEITRRQWLTIYQLREFQKGRARELFLGPYFVLDVLGEGGMGRVFKARHTRLGREVALKVIRKEKLSNPVAVSRFKQEMHAAGQLSHPNVVIAYDAEDTEAGLFLSMEFVEGIDLTKWVKANGQMPVVQACDAIRQAALGLQHAFERGMVHRDIKPSNMILTPRGQVKLLDLGLAMLNHADMPGGENANRVTQDGYVLGTPDFLAPEQAQNPTGVDIRADIYALGATLFYLLTARVPFEASTPTEKLMKHVTAPPPSAMELRPDVPAALDGLIRWLMAKRPEDRPQTPMMVASALQPYCMMQSTFPTPQPMPFPTSGSPTMSLGYHPPVAAPVMYPQATQPYMPTEPVYDAPSGPNPFADMRVDDEEEVDERPRKRKKGQEGEEEHPRKKKKLADGEVRVREPKKRSNLTLYLVGGGGISVILIGAIVLLCGVFSNPLRRLLPDKPLEAEYTNEIGQSMKRMEAGDFTMGSNVGEEGRDANEGPQTSVHLSKSFYISVTEVTRDQWSQLMNKSNSVHSAKPEIRLYLPETNVSWDDAMAFCKKLNAKKGESDRRYGWEYRLPTEAEWEYCCRAGTNTRFSFGDRIKMQDEAVFRFDETIAYGEPHPTVKVDRNMPLPVNHKGAVFEDLHRAPNQFGLLDMHGNVWEWCMDYYSDQHPGGSVTDPTGPDSAPNNWRVMRGGAYNEDASKCRSATRKGEAPNIRDKAVGFRVVFAPKK